MSQTEERTESEKRGDPENAKTEPGRPEPGSRSRRRRSSGPTVRNQFKVNNLYGANFGVDAPRRVATALKDAADVDAELRRYVPPTGFGAATDQLRLRHVLVIEGVRGLGRYTGALALLREVVQGDLVPISPTVTLEELHTQQYEKGCGYYVLEHSFPEVGPEAEFRWNAACVAVKNARAYLVITTADGPGYAGAVQWRRPDLDKILKAFLGNSDGHQIDALIGRVPPDWSPSDVVEVSHRLQQSGDMERALSVFELTAIDEVRSWFNDPAREWTDFVEIAALGFIGCASPRMFESMVGDLELSANAYLPAGEQSGEEREKAVARLLRRRQRRSTLIREERMVQSGIPRQTLVFRSPSHRHQVMEALWSSQSLPFWNGVQDWVLDLVEDDNLDDEQLVQLAQGIVLLAKVNAEEAIDSYLEPFADGEAGEAGAACASNVLRLMALDDALATLALQIAVSWISGPLLKRLIAGEALMTELGALYPAEAAKRLWQLISQDELLDGIAFTSPGALLQTLVELDADVMPLLEMLNVQLDRLTGPRVTMRLTDLVLRTVQHALGRTDERTGRSVAFELLLAHPETSDRLGRLWAGVLANRRYRADALGAIWDGMFASGDRDLLAARLTEALAAVLTPAEQDRFVLDFTVIDRRKRQRDPKRAASLAHLLIDAMARIHGETTMENR